MLLVFVVGSGSEVGVRGYGHENAERPAGERSGSEFRIRVSVRVFVFFLLVFVLFRFVLQVFCFVLLAGGGAGRAQRLACGLPEDDVRFTILPLQRTEHHMNEIKIIDIGRRKPLVMHAYIQ